MSLEYYLLCRKKYDNIINNLKNIIDNYDDIFSYTDDLETETAKYITELFQPIIYKEQFHSKLKCIYHLKNICENNILRLCNHEFVDDIIDINPDESKYIRYCSICELTK